MTAPAHRTFGFRLLRQIAGRSPGKNVIISPLSIFLALQMTERGSGGDTKTAIGKVLGLPDDSPVALLTAVGVARPSTQLIVANALWADHQFKLAPDFVKVCESVFRARATSLDFKDPHAAAIINDWVKTNTNGRIARLVTPEALAAAALVLTNAIYFAGEWRAQFPISETAAQPFHAAGGAKLIPMMHRSRLIGAYRSGGNFEAAQLSYQESTVFFHALLPRPGTSTNDVLASLDSEPLDRSPSEFDLDLKFPRFSLDFSASLVEDLEKMGLGVAFHYPQADFGPMGSGELFISDFIHKTRLEVDEKGTVAAAASSVLMAPGAFMPKPRPIKSLVFDRPFVFLIGESRSGGVLFAGVIEDPVIQPAKLPPDRPESPGARAKNWPA
jgi:serine protease inhibitor